MLDDALTGLVDATGKKSIATKFLRRPMPKPSKQERAKSKVWRQGERWVFGGSGLTESGEYPVELGKQMAAMIADLKPTEISWWRTAPPCKLE